MNEETRKLLLAGKSIVPSLVEIGLQAHRPFEAMVDEVLSVNQKFASKVSNTDELGNYLQKELVKARNEYTKRIQEFL